jgi:hypothetical protein
MSAARGKKAPTEGKNPQALAEGGRREAGELPGALPLSILEEVGGARLASQLPIALSR